MQNSKKPIRIKVNKQSKNIERKTDIVIFMSAYKSSGISEKLFSLKRKAKINDLFKKHHISSFLTNNCLLTPKGGLILKAKFDYIKQSTDFKFEVKNKKQKIEDYESEISRLKWCFALKNSLYLLLDDSNFDIPFYFNMEQFLVYFDDEIFQVDPVVFYLNDTLVITFELINYSNGKPLEKNKIFGKANNFNIIPVTAYKYFGDNDKIITNRTIPQIIYENIFDFTNSLLRNKYKFDHVRYVHNFLVVTNSKMNINKYFTKVLGADNIELNLTNLNTNNAYKYYSKEYLGLVLFESNEVKEQVLFDSIILESMKMIILLNLIINYDVIHGLEDTINNNMLVNLLLFSPNTPISTRNSIENIQQTETYKLRKNAIEFKISYLNLQNEKRKNKNALLLNILLYFLTFIGSLGTVQILSEIYNLSFNICFLIISAVFGILGIVWLILEMKKH